MPPEKEYFHKGKYYKRSNYYKVLKKERQEAGDRYQLRMNENAVRRRARDELLKIMRQWEQNDELNENAILTFANDDDTPFCPAITVSNAVNESSPMNEISPLNASSPINNQISSCSNEPSLNVSLNEGCDYASTNFTDVGLCPQNYLPPASSACVSSVLHTPEEIAANRIHTMFVVHKATTRLQNAILKFIKEVPGDVLKSLPLNHRSLRNRPIDHVIYDLPPGRMLYFSIRTILAIPDVELFDRSSNEICLSVGIDGLPLFADINGVGFWPILGAVARYPVFLIGLYGGKSKPTCPNAFLRPFVKEVKQYEKNGLLLPSGDASTSSASENCGVKVYRFRLVNLIMDLPALSYITCIVGHTAAAACPKCMNIAISAVLRSKGVTKDGKIKKGVRYSQVYDAAPRTPDDFRICLKQCLLENMNEGQASTDCCMDYTRVREYDQRNNVEEDELFRNAFEVNEEDEFDEDEQFLRDHQFMKTLKQHHYQEYRKKKNLPNPHHVTILILLLYFNIIDDVPVEYMHAVCIGIMKILLDKWTTVAVFKMSPKDTARMNVRLLLMRKYFPVEFQRKPESLEVLSSWKATQYRSFLLYIGAVALRGILHPQFLAHFYILVTAMRTLVCRVDNTANRSRILAARAKKAHTLLQYFVKQAVELYGDEVATLKFHLLLHISDDYLRFGPLDEWSAFRFESFLGQLKRLTRGHTNPLAEVVNSYSSLLQTGTFGHVGNRGVDSLHEYYEQPEVKYSFSVDEKTMANFECGQSAEAHSQYGSRYKRLYVKSFLLRVDRDADSCCVVDGDIFLKVREIFHNSVTNRTYLCGNTFKIVGSLFTFVAPNDVDVHTTYEYESEDVGMLEGRLTTNTYTCEFGSVNQKVCAIPLMDDDQKGPPTLSDKYALLRFLH